MAAQLRVARLAAFLADAMDEPRGGDSVEDLVLQTAQVYAQAVTEQTRRSYTHRWRAFEQWCTEQGETALPASPETVMLYLAQAAQADRPVSLSTLRGRVAAINRVHVEAGYLSPGEDPAMTLFMRGLSRVVSRQARDLPISALRIEDLREVMRLLSAEAVDPVQVRDRALLVLRAAGVTDPALAALTWAEVTVTAKSVTVTLPRTARKAMRVLRLAQRADARRCPVDAVRAWRDLGAADGLMFPPTRGSTTGRLLRHPEALHKVILSRTDSLGVDGEPASLATAAMLLAGEPSAVLRDRAILLLGFAGAMRCTEVADLRWSDLQEHSDGLIVTIRRSKTDPYGRGRRIGIPYGRSALTCPVTAALAWRQRVQDQYGRHYSAEFPCLVAVGRAGRIGQERQTPPAVSRLVHRRVTQAGLPGHWGGRSLRAGFITTAAELEVPLELIARQSRHASLESLTLYIRHDDVFRRNAASSLGL